MEIYVYIDIRSFPLTFFFGLCQNLAMVSRNSKGFSRAGGGLLLKMTP